MEHKKVMIHRQGLSRERRGKIPSPTRTTIEPGSLEKAFLYTTYCSSDESKGKMINTKVYYSYYTGVEFSQVIIAAHNVFILSNIQSYQNKFSTELLLTVLIKRFKHINGFFNSLIDAIMGYGRKKRSQIVLSTPYNGCFLRIYIYSFVITTKILNRPIPPPPKKKTLSKIIQKYYSSDLKEDGWSTN